MASMEGVAEAVAVDLLHHLHHPAGGLFSRGRIVLPFRVGASCPRMAVPAAHIQGSRKETHRPHEFVDGQTFQHLDVFEDVIRHLRFRGSLSLTLRENNPSEW
jgi:hypothetical protein